jgi:recombination protein RecA
MSFDTPTSLRPEQRAAAVADAIRRLDKQFGTGTVMRLDGEAVAVDTIPTGSLLLDRALGCGGYPRGRVVEIYGPEASGKTTLTLHAIANAQAAGGVCAFIDAEHALDPVYARKLGVQLDQLLVSQPDDGEQALEVAEQLVSSGGVDLVVIDSVAALVPRAELEGDMADLQVGLQARLMSKGLRKLTGVISRTRATVIFINQLRQKIGVTFGPSEVTAGGNALKYYASQRLEVRRIGKVAEGDEAVGNRTRVKVVKNKMAPPFREAEFDIFFGKGVSTEGEILQLGEEQGVLSKSGSWYSLGDERIANGKEAVRRRIEEDVALRARLLGLLRPAA